MKLQKSLWRSRQLNLNKKTFEENLEPFEDKNQIKMAKNLNEVKPATYGELGKLDFEEMEIKLEKNS